MFWRMKLISFEWEGAQRFGGVRGDGVVDLTGRVEGARSLRALIELNLLDAARGAIDGGPTLAALENVTLLPVIPDPGKIVLVGGNYHDHRAEMARPDTPAYPMLFTRFPECQVGHRSPLVAPRASVQFDYEGEIALVIGRGGRNIAREHALSHVAGYSAYNDATVRDWQRHTAQFTPGKNFDATGAFGPWLLTVDEVADYREFMLTTRLNGQVMQHASARDLIFDVEALIAYISAFTTLRPGDVIVTGTCGGVGFARKPQVFLKPGDIVEVEIGGLGVLSNPVIAEA
jgi:2-keto-4-pentenoate hydratase/2-oxohepta-3-ene-1,7-dioic acid hydratase in catechol pathway